MGGKKKKLGIKQVNKQKEQSFISKRKRVTFTIITIFLPILLFIIFETLLRVLGFGNDLQLVFERKEKSEKWLEINPNVAKRYFVLNPDFARQAEEARLIDPKPEKSFRIICLGGSSMAGFPFNKNATMPGILSTYLKQLLPNYEIEVINLGIAATNSFTVRDLMPDVVKLQPDAILVYSGHNEFYGALGVGSTFSLSRNRNLINGYLKLIRLRTVRFLQTLVEKISVILNERDQEKLDIPVMQRMAKDQEIPFGSSLFKKACHWFEDNLSDLVSIAQTNNIPIFVGNLVCNLKNQPPFISKTLSPLEKLQHDQWISFYGKGLQFLQKNSIKKARTEFIKAYKIDSTDADLNYSLAKCELVLGEVNNAEKLFARARDLDQLRFRAPDTFNTIIADVIQKHNVPVVDIFNTFRNNSPDFIIGNEHIAEHLHPTISGNILMAKTYLFAMQKSSIFPVQINNQNILSLSETLKEIYISSLDQEIGRQRIFHLTANWPFKNQIDLAVEQDEAIHSFIQETASEYINRKITWVDAHLNVAEKYSQLKLFDKAFFEYQILIHQYTNEYAFYDRAGDVLISLQKYNVAMNYFSKSIKINSDSPFSRAGLGKTLMFLGRFREAEAAFSEAIRLNRKENKFSPNYRSFILYLWGGALVNLKKYGAAEAKFVEAIQVDPNNQLAKNFLSELQQKLKK